MTTVSFAVIYRWRLKRGREGEFRSAWERLTKAICKERGGRGSRLHRADDGTWLAYAHWPERARWERARELESPDKQAAAQMRSCIDEAMPPLPLELIADMLAGESPTDAT